MATDPYEIARRIAREKMDVDLEHKGFFGCDRSKILYALLAAIEEGRRLGANDVCSTKTTPNANSLQL